MNTSPQSKLRFPLIAKVSNGSALLAGILVLASTPAFASSLPVLENRICAWAVEDGSQQWNAFFQKASRSPSVLVLGAFNASNLDETLPLGSIIDNALVSALDHRKTRVAREPMWAAEYWSRNPAQAALVPTDELLTAVRRHPFKPASILVAQYTLSTDTLELHLAHRRVPSNALLDSTTLRVPKHLVDAGLNGTPFSWEVAIVCSFTPGPRSAQLARKYVLMPPPGPAAVPNQLPPPSTGLSPPAMPTLPASPQVNIR